MSPIRFPSTRLSPIAALFALLTLGVGEAAADPATYNLILKQGNPATALTCARGAFVFDKAAVLQQGKTSGATTSATVTIDPGCFQKLVPRTDPPVYTPWPTTQLNMTGTLTIHLKNLTSKQEHPVPSVYGVTGDLVSGNNVIRFSYNPTTAQRSARVCDSLNCSSSIAVLTYHAVNTNSIPEPETLALVLLGALGLGLARWRARRPV